MTPSALITGATGGIGHAIAGALAPTHHLFLAGRNIEALQLVAASFPSATPLLADLGFPGGMDQLAAQISSLDVLVHSAGILRMGTVEETAQNDWEQSMQVNVLAPVELTPAQGARPCVHDQFRPRAPHHCRVGCIQRQQIRHESVC